MLTVYLHTSKAAYTQSSLFQFSLDTGEWILQMLRKYLSSLLFRWQCPFIPPSQAPWKLHYCRKHGLVWNFFALTVNLCKIYCFIDAQHIPEIKHYIKYFGNILRSFPSRSAQPDLRQLTIRQNQVSKALGQAKCCRAGAQTQTQSGRTGIWAKPRASRLLYSKKEKEALGVTSVNSILNSFCV